MAEQKQAFRFRLPWLSAQRTTAQPQRPRPTSETSRAPSQPTTSVPIQRPAFRPAGRAPTQPPSPQPQPPAKAEPESPPPSSSEAIESTETSPPATADKPPSPSSAASNARKVTSQSTSSPSRATTKPQSPSRATTESPKAISPTSSPSAATAKQVSPSSAAAESRKDTSQTASSPSSATAKPSSPPRAATESPKATSRLASSETAKPPSPSSEVSSPSQKANQQEPEPMTGMVTRSPSSPDKSQTIDQDSSSASLASTQTQKSAPQEEPKKSTSQTPSQELKPEVDITSETTEKPVSRDDAMVRDSTKVSSPTKATATFGEATDEPVSPIATDQKPLFKVEKESKETEGKKETTQETLKEEKTDKATTEEEPMQKTIIEAPGTRRDTKETLDVAPKAPRRRQKQESLERKETTAPTSYSGKQIKTVIPSQPTEGTTSTSFRKPFSFTEEEEAPQQKEIKEEISKLVWSLTSGLQSDEKPVTVITLTGENRGAAMQLSSEAAKKKGSIHIHRGYKTDPDESPETTTDGEVRTNWKRFNDQTALAPTAFVNSNVQNINNSIVFEASVAERSPGVYMSFSQGTSEVIKSNGKSEFVQTRKAEYIPTPSEKLTHQPNVRRRCLRGLFMEPSDSDPDDPDKPRRHGCRYICGERSKDKEIM
ncbi:hypothetical protein TIFTF001_007958 [Ficus carica]|uniref:Uncharacterized protein n=1 Tax=Ficus carica TaxID=3494 RepID=A0AA87ZSI7_FICCA|nr:hypothetical protein TIFTF001_007958 [Ficus carica]